MARITAAWGIDVGVTALKAIKLRRDGDGVIVEAFDVVEHEHFLTEPDVNRDETIRHTLQKFLERNNLKREAVFVGVPGSSTFARFVKLPPVEPKKIPEIVRFEAMQQIPFPLEQVNWDYQTFSSPDTPEVEVGIFAMKKELVTQVMDNFRSHAMIVEGVQMSPLAAYNAVVFDGMTDGKGTIVVDIGAEHTDLIFVDAGRVWVRTINIGGNNFTDSLSKSFKVPFAKAEQLKRTAATSKYAKQIFQAMRPVFADLVAEIQRSKGFYDSSHRDSKIERIIGMGNPFKLPNLQKYIQQELKLEVIRLEAFKKAQMEGKVAAGLNDHILSMGAAFGLALQGLDKATIDTNLLPMDIARQMLWRQKRSWFVAAAACVVAAVGVYGYKGWHDSKVFADSQLSPEASQHTSLAGEYGALQTSFNAIPDRYKEQKTQIDSIKDLAGDRKIWPQIYTDIVKSLPQTEATLRQAPASQRKAIVLTNITPFYSSSVMNASALNLTNPSGGQGGAAPAAVMPPSVGSGLPVAGTPSPVPDAGQAVPDLRGFAILIQGYTSYNPPAGRSDTSRKVVKDYLQALMDKARVDDTTKSYYFIGDPGAPGGYLGSALVAANAATGSQTKPPWSGGSKGTFWDAFGSTLVKPDLNAPTMGMGGAGTDQTIDIATHPIDPDTKESMEGYFMFRIPFRVILRNPTP